MRGQDLARLRALAGLLHQRDTQALAQVLAEEARLRQRLGQLEAQARQAVIDAQDLGALRSLGAETLWQDWALRRRAELNSELARIRLRREHAVARLGRSFGKRDALGRLQKDAESKALRKHRAAEEAALATGSAAAGGRSGSDLLTGDLGDQDVGDRSW